MDAYLSDLKIELCRYNAERVVAAADEFVKAMSANGQSVEHYATTRRTSESAAKSNFKCCMISEFSTEIALRDYFGWPSIEVDIEVRTGREKGFRTDLIYPKPFPLVHVKSCSAQTVRNVGDFSWTFQFVPQDAIFREPSNTGSLLALVYVEHDLSTSATIKCLCRWADVRHLMKPPRRADFGDSKKCLYFCDIQKALLHKDGTFKTRALKEQEVWEKYVRIPWAPQGSRQKACERLWNE